MYLWLHELLCESTGGFASGQFILIWNKTVLLFVVCLCIKLALTQHLSDIEVCSVKKKRRVRDCWAVEAKSPFTARMQPSSHVLCYLKLSINRRTKYTYTSIYYNTIMCILYNGEGFIDEWTRTSTSADASQMLVAYICQEDYQIYIYTTREEHCVRCTYYMCINNNNRTYKLVFVNSNVPRLCALKMITSLNIERDSFFKTVRSNYTLAFVRCSRIYAYFEMNLWSTAIVYVEWQLSNRNDFEWNIYIYVFVDRQSVGFRGKVSSEIFEPCDNILIIRAEWTALTCSNTHNWP